MPPEMVDTTSPPAISAPSGFEHDGDDQRAAHRQGIGADGRAHVVGDIIGADVQRHIGPENGGCDDDQRCRSPGPSGRMRPDRRPRRRPARCRWPPSGRAIAAVACSSWTTRLRSLSRVFHWLIGGVGSVGHCGCLSPVSWPLPAGPLPWPLTSRSHCLAQPILPAARRAERARPTSPRGRCGGRGSGRQPQDAASSSRPKRRCGPASSVSTISVSVVP